MWRPAHHIQSMRGLDGWTAGMRLQSNELADTGIGLATCSPGFQGSLATDRHADHPDRPAWCGIAAFVADASPAHPRAAAWGADARYSVSVNGAGR